ncbi:hypothetical protein [Posidoniimonas corsicana]|uniref:hypothetical protein n=1 Tax=Posidoniimonas corsicana TaxID=1938618 RepID=UPI0011B6F02D|nr:hypothetical protein [Posidoniimonas corsicana]
MSGGWLSARAGLVLLCLALWSAPRDAAAAITSSGEVTPDPVTANNPSSELRIGVGNDPEDVDPRARVTVDGGSVLEYDQVFVGYDEGFFGRLLVSGAGTAVEFNDGGANSDVAVEVGRRGNGYFALTEGATLNLSSTSSDMAIGRNSGSIGEVLIDGADTFATLGEDVLVGVSGDGKLTVSGGALMRTTRSGSVVTLGVSAGSSGLMIVDGQFTTFQSGHHFNVGGSGVGELHISNGGLVDADNTSTAQATVGVLGRLYLSDGTLDVRDLDVAGYLGGHGVVRGQVDVATTGDVEVNPGQRLDFNNTFNNAGAVTVTGGELRLLGANSNAATGRYTLEYGTVRFAANLTNDGVIASADGVNNIHGEVTNNGNVVVASETVAVFNDAYTDNGTTTVLARGNALFLSDLTFTSASQLALGLSTDEGSAAAAQVEVAGAATLAGELMLNFEPGFDYGVSQSIELLYADGGISGAFVPPVFPTVQGVDFGLNYGANSLTLDVTVDPNNLLDGDFNFDGVVDAADYTVWRDGLGTTFGPGDYDIWRANYGATANSGVASPTAAPSPSGLVCLLAAGVCVALRRR